MERGKAFFKSYPYAMFRMLIGLFGMVCANMVWAVEVNYLQDVKMLPAHQNKVQILLEFTHPVNAPKSFSVEAPPTLVFDFASVKNKLPKALLHQSFNDEVLKKINVVETENKTRIIVELKQLVPFETETEGNTLKIILDAGKQDLKAQPFKQTLSGGAYQIKGFDFRRGDNGEGRLIVDLSNAKAAVDFKEDNGQIRANFVGGTIADKLAKHYDVSDFATPIRSIDVVKEDNRVGMIIDAVGEYDNIAYQIDNQFIVEVRSVTKEEQMALKAATWRYTGDKISLNFQNIEIRAILKIIADFSGFNVVTSDSVGGSITLRLQNVPWDQALDIILQSKGLAKREANNVMLVAPATEIASREKADLEGQKSLEELGPLKSEFIQINYASAEDLSALLKDKSNSLLTSRGNVTVDKRTNILLVQDVEPKLAEVRALLKKLDVPVRQVEISTQIVTADNTLESALGVRFGGGANLGLGHRRLGVGSAVDRARAIADFQDSSGNSAVPGSNAVIDATGAYNETNPTVNNTEGLFSDLGTPTLASGLSPAKLGLALAKLPNGTLLDLELQALESESKSRTIARPKLVTMDQNKATVEQGVDIPYAEATSSGATSIAFKTAALKLEVTPHIIPDDKISLDLQISKDTQGSPVGVSTAPVINTNRLQTKVLVDNGETIVLGGVLNVADTKSIAKVPFFGDLPLIGGLFRNRYAKYVPSELIIFLTPKIISPLTATELPGGEAE